MKFIYILSIMDIWDTELERAFACLQEGGVILTPTDTVWGLSCDATQPAAVKKILRIKVRPQEKGLLVLVDSVMRLQEYVGELSDDAVALIETDDRPLTVVYPHSRGFASEVLAPDGSVGIRITRAPFMQALIRRLGHAIVSTSANVSGQAFDGSYQDVSPEVRKAVDFVVALDQSKKIKSKPSRIVKLMEDGSVAVIRE